MTADSKLKKVAACLRVLSIASSSECESVSVMGTF